MLAGDTLTGHGFAELKQRKRQPNALGGDRSLRALVHKNEVYRRSDARQGGELRLAKRALVAFRAAGGPRVIRERCVRGKRRELDAVNGSSPPRCPPVWYACR